MRAMGFELELRLGETHNALWADTEDRVEEIGPEAQKFGIVFGIRWGVFIRPLGGWTGKEPVKTLRFPFVFPWLSVAVGQYGGYIGAKEFDWHPRYVANEIWPDGDFGDTALTFSASVRRTRMK